LSWRKEKGAIEVDVKMLLRGVSIFLSFIWLMSMSHAAAVKEGVLRTVVDDAEEKGVYWDYSDGPFGPAHWGELSPSWNICIAGQSQSPIDIDTGKLMYDQHLDVPAAHDYRDTEAYVVNTGHSVQVWTLSQTPCGLVHHLPSL
jgi:carbonic anhydrase